MAEVTLHEILAAKEARAARRRQFQTEHPGTCVSLSLNIPGPVKDSARVRALFRYAVNGVCQRFEVGAASVVQERTGPHAVFAVGGEPLRVKEASCRLEEERPYGRLLDLDVYDASGLAVAWAGRGSGRPCLVCGGLAVACMRGRKHGLDEISAAVDGLFAAFHADMSRHVSPRAEFHASLALEAVLYEAAAAPAPGLVDPFHRGSHRDMDFFTFMRSSAAIALGLARCVQCGLNHDGEPHALLPVLRLIGMEAEQSMFRATGGVNTHKGILFSLGLTLGAVGLLLRDNAPVAPAEVGTMLQAMSEGIVARELGGDTRTAGERAYRDYGIAGIRGEVEAGLPSVFEAGLPALERALARDEDHNRALVHTLVALMARVDDTTILARSSGIDALRGVQGRARGLLESGRLDGDRWRDVLHELDADLVAANISPGGSADLLALTWFMHVIGKAARTA